MPDFPEKDRNPMQMQGLPAEPHQVAANRPVAIHICT